MDNFVKHEKLGEGTYGVVYKATDKHTGDIIALKRTRLNQAEDGIPVNSIREISLLKTLHHPNIIELREVVHSSGKLTLAFEYMHTDLRHYLQSAPGPLPPLVIKSYSDQILAELSYCH
jgi:serine/threonine protein kinase